MRFVGQILSLSNSNGIDFYALVGPIMTAQNNELRSANLRKIIKRRSAKSVKRLREIGVLPFKKLVRFASKTSFQESQNEAPETHRSPFMSNSSNQMSSGYTLQSPTTASRIHRFFSNVNQKSVRVPEIPPLGQPLALPKVNTVSPITGTDLTTTRPLTYSDRDHEHYSDFPYEGQRIGLRNVENEEVLELVGQEHLQSVSSSSEVRKGTSLEPINSMHHPSKFIISKINDEEGNEIGEIVDPTRKVETKHLKYNCFSHVASS